MASNQRATSTKTTRRMPKALHKQPLELQLWSLPALYDDDDDDDDDDDVFCDDDHDDDDHDDGASYGSLALPSRLQALLRLWMPFHTSRGLLPLLRLQELLQQQTLRVPHKSPGQLQSWRWLELCMLALQPSRLVLLPPCKLQMPLRKSWLWPALCKLALHKSQLGLQSWLWQVLCTLSLHMSLPLLLKGVPCDDDHDDGALYASLSLPNRLQALLRLWMPFHTSPGLLPLLRLQEPLRQWRSQVPLKLKNLLMTLRTQRLQMPLGLRKSRLELQSWSWPAWCKLALQKSQLGLQSWLWQVLCTLTLRTSLPLLLNGVCCDDDHDDGALYASLSLSSRLQALLRL